MMDLNVLLVGQTDRTEFIEARRWLEHVARTKIVVDLQAAQARLDLADGPPELIVLAQSRPGEFAADRVQHLVATAPLARIVSLLGSWCEGEARSGTPWPGVVRTYWHQWLPRFQQELARQQAGQTPLWSQPVTASAQERLLLMSAEQRPIGTGTIGVYSEDHAVGRFLATALESSGFTPLMIGDTRARVEGLRAALWEASRGGARECATLTQVKQAVRPAPVVALLSFPRPKDAHRARKAGAAAIISKPLLLADLDAELSRVVLHSQRRDEYPASLERLPAG